MLLVRRSLCLLFIFCSAVQAGPIWDMLGPNAQNALRRAQREAHRTHCGRVTEEHFFWALLQDDQPEVRAIINNGGGADRLKTLQAKADGLVAAAAEGGRTQNTDLPPIGEELSQFIRTETSDASRNLRDLKISSEVMLLSFADNGEEKIRKVISESGLQRSEIVRVAEQARGRAKEGQPILSGALFQFGEDMTEAARRGDYVHIEGRAEQITDMRGAFMGSGSRLVTLIADDGVGKSSSLEEVALLTSLSDSDPAKPREWKRKRLVKVDISGLSAGAAQANQAEGNLRALLKAAAETRGTDQEVLLVFEDLRAPEPNKPHLNIAGEILRMRSELPGVFVTADHGVWKSYLETKAKWGGIGREIFLDPPERLESIRMLQSHRARIERDYGVVISDNAIAEIYDLAKRYMADLPEPRRSIELMKLTCEKFKLAVESDPPAVQIVELDIKNIKTELYLWESKPKSFITERKIAELNGKLHTAERKLVELKSQFEDAVKVRKEVDRLSIYARQLREYLDFTGTEKIEIDRPHYEQLLANTERDLAPKLAQFTQLEKEFPNLSFTVNKAHIVTTIAKAKKIPINHMTESEAERLARLPEFLDRNLVGQEKAKKAIIAAVNRIYSHLKDPNKPIVLRFRGETGVGKTQLAELLAEFLFGSSDAMVQKDGGNLAEKHRVSEMIGSPTGYVGADEGGGFTNQINRRPYCVALLDEWEKTHEAMRNLLYPWFDKGKGQDAMGRRIDFSNVIFIVTDNLKDIKGEPGEYADAFRNRMVEIDFDKLEEVELEKVFDIHIKPVIERVLENTGIILDETSFPKEVKEKIAADAYKNFGAREIKRLIEHYIVDPIAANAAAGEYKSGDVVRFFTEDVEVEPGKMDKVVSCYAQPAKPCAPAVEAMSGNADN